MKIFTRAILVILCTSFFTVQCDNVLAASTQISFSSDQDWSTWVKKDVDLVSIDGGTDLGLRLKKTATGKYELTGTIIYKVSPEGQATWGDMVNDKTLPTGTNIDFSFSSSEISIEQAYADVKARADVKSNPRDIGASDFLYVRADLFPDVTAGVGVSTPILKSLTLNYVAAKTPSVAVEKHIYRYLDTDAQKLLETATFTPGMMATVKIKLSATDAMNLTFKAEDYLSRGAETVTNITNIDEAVKYCGLDKTKDTLLNTTYSKATDSVVFDGINLDGVSGYLCYSYFVPSSGNPRSSWQAKNDIQQVRLNVSTGDMIVATSSNYLMVRGFAFSQNDTSQTLTNLIPIDDELLFSFDKFIFKGLSGQDVFYTSAPSYTYKRGIAAKSRGGSLYNLPVAVTDLTGEVTLSSDSYYLLYNPSVYLMGNLFSKNSLPDASLDFGSKNNVVSGSAYDSSSKLNAQAGLYSYSIDQSSVAYWDGANSVKSKAMQANIDRIIGNEVSRPENFCDMGNDISTLSDGKLIYLTNQDCQINISGLTNIWPDGRVWYFKPTGDVDLSATIMKSGTLVFDFSAAVNSSVRIGTIASDFASGANIGVILINGGNVVFTKKSNTFNGMIFVPGK